MIGIILSGHGTFATGLMSSMELIAGKQESVVCVDFTINDSSETLQAKLENAVEVLKECEGILFLTDIAGGSPFRTCALIAKDNMRVVAGTNLGMLLEVSLMRVGLDCDGLKDMAIECGINGIKAYELAVKKQTCSDGI